MRKTQSPFFEQIRQRHHISLQPAPPHQLGVWGVLKALPVWSGAEPQSNLNLVHFSQKYNNNG